MYALIQKSQYEASYWDGGAWAPQRDALRFDDHAQAARELEQHEEDSDFDSAFVVDIG